jgi:hypothetical protein
MYRHGALLSMIHNKVQQILPSPLISYADWRTIKIAQNNLFKKKNMPEMDGIEFLKKSGP